MRKKKRGRGEAEREERNDLKILPAVAGGTGNTCWMAGEIFLS